MRTRRANAGPPMAGRLPASRRDTLGRWAFLPVLLLLIPQPLPAQTQGSAHDFSAKSWSGGQICIVCHATHDANLSVQESPLWNHEVTSSSFIPYTSPTLDTVPGQPRGPSKLCLSCHDGVVAINSFGGMVGNEWVAGGALIGTDLTNDHPISIYWDHQTGITACSGCHNVHLPSFTGELPFFGHHVECPTCHDVHAGSAYPKLVRKPLAGSQLCFHCHGK